MMSDDSDKIFDPEDENLEEQENDANEEVELSPQDLIDKLVAEQKQKQKEEQNELASMAAAPPPPKEVKKQTAPVNVNKVELDTLLANNEGIAGAVNLELLLNLPLNVSIELGRTQLLIKEVLALGIGSIIELNKVAGESIDLLVNNKKFAEGEVVVIEENFGIRITNIVKSKSEMDVVNAAINAKNS